MVELARAYMSAKQIHCTPSCAMPNRPVKHSEVSTWLQHAMSSLDGGTVRMLANPEVAEVTPKRTNQGDMPSEVRRDMMR